MLLLIPLYQVCGTGAITCTLTYNVIKNANSNYDSYAASTYYISQAWG